MPIKKRTVIDPDELATIRRYIALSRDVLERFADLAEEARGVFKRIYALEEIVDEWFSGASEAITQLGRQIDRIERLMLLDKMGQGNTPEAIALREKIKAEQDVKFLQQLLGEEHDTLNRLKVREAKYGGEAPVWLLKQIDETQKRIEVLRDQLNL